MSARVERDVNALEEAFGELTVSFVYSGTQRGELRHVWLDDARSELSFEFWRTWGGDYGPVTFSLTRL